MPAHYMPRYITVLLLAWLWPTLMMFDSGWAQDNIDPPEAAKTFASGKRMLRESDWLGAARVFEQLAGRYPNSKNIDLFIFYRSKAQYYFGELNEAAAGFSYIISSFPQSQYRPYVHFFLANTYYRKRDVVRALDNYLESYRLSSDSRLNDLDLKSITAIFDNAGTVRIDQSEFDDLNPEKRCTLVKGLLDKLAAHSQLDLARSLAESCGLPFDVSRYSHLETPQETSLEIAMVLPFSGELKAFGEDIYNGAVIAAEMCRNETGQKVKLTPYDTKNDPVDAARIIGELINSSVDAIIGPLTSEEAAVASAKLDRSQIPMIIPAATQAGLTRLSESSFQLSPNIELEGVKAAEYAVNVLGADSSAIITSTTTDNLRISRAFAERFKQLGGTIVATEYYRTRDKDFGPYIRDIKSLLLGAIPDSVYFIDERGDTLDIDGLPANIDCLFLPGEQKQIRLLLPQIHFYNLNGAYIGSDGWGDNTIYRLGDDITKGAVFPSPFLTSSHSDSYIRMAAAYDTHYGKSPRRLASLGYDALHLICQAYAEGVASPMALVNYLRQISHYEGASGTITFGPNRENIEMPFYRILGGITTPVELSPQTETNSSAP